MARDLDLGLGQTAYCRASPTSNYLQNFIKIKKTLWMDGHMYIRTDGRRYERLRQAYKFCRHVFCCFDRFVHDKTTLSSLEIVLLMCLRYFHDYHLTDIFYAHHCSALYATLKSNTHQSFG